jgi:hypothetical protein
MIATEKIGELLRPFLRQKAEPVSGKVAMVATTLVPIQSRNEKQESQLTSECC